MSAWPDEDGYEDGAKGWNRASIAFNSRKAYVPDISADDLRLPNEAGKLRTLAICSVCAFCMTILYVGFPMWGASLFVDLGAWFPGTLVVTMVSVTAVLFALSTHETRELRRLSKEL
jgi:hypothetical protein